MTPPLRTLWLALLLGAATPANAAELTHRAGTSESLDSLARDYYGAAWKAAYIAARNGLALDDAVAGRRLVVPTSWIHKVRRGESLTIIAKRKLGDAGRYQAIAAFNGLKEGAELSVGQELLMPFHLTHVVQPGEGLSQISRRYYRTTRHASLVREYNKTTDRLKPGQRLTIPIFDRATLGARDRRPSEPWAAAQSEPATGATPPPRAEPERAAQALAPHAQEPAADPAETRAALQRAVSRYRKGLFGEACPALEQLLGRLDLEGADRASLVKHLGFCGVAFNDKNAARDYFRKWIELDPQASLSPITTSPKILEVFYEVTSAGQLAADDGDGVE